MEAEKLTLAPVTYGPFLEYIVEQGEVMPLRTIYLDAVEGGRVEEVYVLEGSQIEEARPSCGFPTPTSSSASCSARPSCSAR